MTLQNEIENELKEIFNKHQQSIYWSQEERGYPYPPIEVLNELLTLIQDREKKLLDRVEVLIAEEMIIAQKEGQPTSRLTSLAVRLKEII